MSIGIVVTFDRMDLLRECVEHVVTRASSLTREILIVDNASSDGTGAYLDRLAMDRVSVVHNERNIGQNAYREAFASLTSDYLIELDDDIIDAPDAWDETLLEAFQRLPRCGFLAANLVNNPNDLTARIMYGPSRGQLSH